MSEIEMATRLLTRPARLAIYLPSFSAAAARIKSFSAKSSDEHYKRVRRLGEESDTVWPDKHLGPLADGDVRFLLPGSVGADIHINSNKLLTDSAEHSNIFTEKSEEKKYDLVQQLLEQKVGKDEDHWADVELEGDLECAAYSCPDLVRRDMQELFVDKNLMTGNLTVLTLCHHTKNDMTSWSVEVEDERESLLAMYMNEAQEMCSSLQQSGFWADFMDPSSGKPYLGSYTNACMFETDERYRHFGFQIEDIGCCKVIRHHLWGTKTFIGLLITDAPVSSPIIQHLLAERTYS